MVDSLVNWKAVTIEDDSVYVSDDDANYLYKVETYIFESRISEINKSSFALASEGFRPISIDVVNVPTEARDAYGFTIAWVYDENPVDWEIITPRQQSDFDTPPSARSSPRTTDPSRYRAGFGQPPSIPTSRPYWSTTA